MGDEVAIVNEDDQAIGKININEATFSKHITRHVGLILINNENKILLQRRSRKKYLFPFHFDLSVTGFVDLGENYEEAIIREAEEEIGIKIKPNDLIFITKKLIKYWRNEIWKLYIMKYNGDFNINEDEIDFIKFLSINEIEKMIELNEDFTPASLQLMKYFLGKKSYLEDL